MRARSWCSIERGGGNATPIRTCRISKVIATTGALGTRSRPSDVDPELSSEGD